MNSALSGLAARLHKVRRLLLVRRRGLAALAAGSAVLFSVSAATAPPPHTVRVWTAARDLPAGAVLGSGDLRAVGFAPGSVPAHVVASARSALGRTLAAPLGRGQPLSPTDLVRPGMTRGYPGRVAVPVRLTDPAVAALLRVGDRVALVASDPADPARGTTTLATDAAVVTLPAPVDDTGSTSLPGRMVVVAVRPAEADAVATASAASYVTAEWLR
ncbi:MAG TPA: SAF domain-containing protein [Marmoricola sp.]